MNGIPRAARLCASGTEVSPSPSRTSRQATSILLSASRRLAAARLGAGPITRKPTSRRFPATAYAKTALSSTTSTDVISTPPPVLLRPITHKARLSCRPRAVKKRHAAPNQEQRCNKPQQPPPEQQVHFALGDCHNSTRRQRPQNQVGLAGGGLEGGAIDAIVDQAGRRVAHHEEGLLRFEAGAQVCVERLRGAANTLAGAWQRAVVREIFAHAPDAVAAVIVEQR